MLEDRSRFDSIPDSKWIPFVATRVRGAMLDHLRTLPLIRLPQEQRSNVKQLHDAEHQLEHPSQAAGATAEAEHLGWRMAEVRRVAAQSPVVEAADQATPTERFEDGEPLRNLLPDCQPNAEACVLKLELDSVLEHCIKALEHPHHRLVVKSEPDAVYRDVRVRDRTGTLFLQGAREVRILMKPATDYDLKPATGSDDKINHRRRVGRCRDSETSCSCPEKACPKVRL